MLIQQTVKMSRTARFVKGAMITVTALGGLSLSASSASAMSGYETVETTEYTFSFAKSEFVTPEGTSSVYRKLAKKAAKACARGRNVDSAGKIISKAQCEADLLSQFVKSADVQALSAMHTKQAMRQSAGLK